MSTFVYFKKKLFLNNLGLGTLYFPLLKRKLNRKIMLNNCKTHVNYKDLTHKKESVLDWVLPRHE